MEENTIDLTISAINKKADSLCKTAAWLTFGSDIVIFLTYLTATFVSESGIFAIVCAALFLLSLVCAQIGFILIIVMRVKYPWHEGGKKIMMIAIAIIVFAFLCFILSVAMFDCTSTSLCRSFE